MCGTEHLLVCGGSVRNNFTIFLALIFPFVANADPSQDVKTPPALPETQNNGPENSDLKNLERIQKAVLKDKESGMPRFRYYLKPTTSLRAKVIL